MNAVERLIQVPFKYDMLISLSSRFPLKQNAQVLNEAKNQASNILCLTILKLAAWCHGVLIFLAATMPAHHPPGASPHISDRHRQESMDPARCFSNLIPKTIVDRV